jgi:hypothetical protein
MAKSRQKGPTYRNSWSEGATNWSKGLSGVIKASKRTGPTSVALHNKAKKLAQKYYGTTDLTTLSPYQLDKVVTWVTGMNPNTGKNKDRKAGRTLGRYGKNK